MKNTLYSLLFLLPGFVFAQQVPAKPQSKPVTLIGGVAHLGTGEVIKNAIIEFENGKLTLVAEHSGILMDESKKRVIDITGKHVYPGLIAPNTKIGLNEIDAVRPTRDFQEVGQYNPNVRTIIAYNTDSRITPTVRSNGILLAQVSPRGGILPGTSSIVELDAWNWEDAVYKMDDGVHLNWPKSIIKKNPWEESKKPQKKSSSDKIKELKDFFDGAKAYAIFKTPAHKNLKFEAMKGVFDGSKKLFIRVDYVKDIIAAVNFVKDYKLSVVIIGGRDVWMVPDLIKENNISVILKSTHALPARHDDDIDLPFKTPKLLKDAGILFCMGLASSWGQRNLPFVAGTSVAYGLNKEEALQTITSNTAKILGIDKTVGTLEVGKDATLIISTGDILDVKTNNIEIAFIRGKQIDLDNKQKALYRKFSKKYFPEDE